MRRDYVTQTLHHRHSQILATLSNQRMHCVEVKPLTKQKITVINVCNMYYISYCSRPQLPYGYKICRFTSRQPGPNVSMQNYNSEFSFKPQDIVKSNIQPKIVAMFCYLSVQGRGNSIAPK